MQKTTTKAISLVILSLAMIVCAAFTAGAADDADVYDTVELKSGDTLKGTILNNTFTVTTPYTSVTLEKDTVSEINMNSEDGNNDIILLNTGGLMEGTIEEPAISFKPASGQIVTLEKGQCKKIILKNKKG